MDFIFLIEEGIAHVPQSRDALTRSRAQRALSLDAGWGRDVKKARFRDEGGMEVASRLRIEKG